MITMRLLCRAAIATSVVFLLASTAYANGVPCVNTVNKIDSNLFTGKDITLLPPVTGIENTSIGCGALLNVDSGEQNTGAGYRALQLNQSGDNNTASGAWALSSNIDGSNNTASGTRALFSNTSGLDNVAIGGFSLESNSNGSTNIAIGNQAMKSNLSSDANVAIGYNALYSHDGDLYTLDGFNTAIGFSAAIDLKTGINNIAIGSGAGSNWGSDPFLATEESNNIAIGSTGVLDEDNSIHIGTVSSIPNYPAHTSTYIAGIRNVSVSGAQMVVIDASGKLGSQSIPSGGSTSNDFVAGSYNNTASGSGALYYSQVGYGNNGANNTANGYQSMYYNTTGSDNVATGNNAMLDNTTGSRNTASGSGALSTNTTGGNNVAVGYEAAKAQTIGSENTAVGYQAGLKWTTGKGNVALGAGAGINQVTGSNNVAISSPGTIGDTATIRIGKKDIHTATFIAGIRNTTLAGGLAVLVNQNGKLGVATSSRRYKQDIQPMGDASNRLLELRPVSFRYKQAEADGSRPMQYGLIAEEVAEVMPELAVYNEDGTPESVAYQVLPSLLLNEYQKQAKELAAEKTSRLAAEARLEAIEAEMASMKLMLSKLAAAQSGKVQFAAAP